MKISPTKRIMAEINLNWMISNQQNCRFYAIEVSLYIRANSDSIGIFYLYSWCSITHLLFLSILLLVMYVCSLTLFLAWSSDYVVQYLQQNRGYIFLHWLSCDVQGKLFQWWWRRNHRWYENSEIVCPFR